MSLQTQINELFSAQQAEWEQLCDAVEQQGSIQEKKIAWDDAFFANVQFNPARIISTTANTDSQSVGERPCFLCRQNRPSQQKSIPFLDKYEILCNPFPILQNHLVIALRSHKPQRIRRKIDHMLTLAQRLPDYVVFYNGPKCGASAPDHFHLQAGLKTPVLLQGDNELRACLVINADTKEEASERFEDVYRYLRHRQPEEDEPMMNIIAFVQNSQFVVHIFPRKAHRPIQYFAGGSRQLLVSPGALDMAGLFITVREEDFEKTGKHEIEDVYTQVSMTVI